MGFFQKKQSKQRKRSWLCVMVLAVLFSGCGQVPQETIEIETGSLMETEMDAESKTEMDIETETEAVSVETETETVFETEVVTISEENEEIETETTTENTTEASTEDTTEASTEVIDLADAITIADYEMPYYIRINVEANVVNIYQKADAVYVPYTAFLTSCGQYTLEEGVFALSDHYEWRELYGGSYGHYAVRIYSGLLFHSVPCREMDLSTMDQEAYAALGTRASLGCMRLKDEDAKWIYENCSAGTLTEFYMSDDPGPFGKPEL